MSIRNAVANMGLSGLASAFQPAAPVNHEPHPGHQQQLPAIQYIPTPAPVVPAPAPTMVHPPTPLGYTSVPAVHLLSPPPEMEMAPLHKSAIYCGPGASSGVPYGV